MKYACAWQLSIPLAAISPVALLAPVISYATVSPSRGGAVGLQRGRQEGLGNASS